MTTCTWTWDDPDGNTWKPSCGGDLYEFYENGPTANKFAFCPYCGQPLVEVRPEPEPEDEDEDAVRADGADAACPECLHAWATHLNLNGCCVQHEGAYCNCQRMPDWAVPRRGARHA